MEYLVLERRLRRLEEVLRRRQKDLRLLVDQVRNEHNFSAILRTADAVGLLYVYYHKGKGVKAKINEGVTQGAHKWLFVEETEEPEELVKRFKREGYQVVATLLSEDSVDFRSVDYTKPTLLVVGNEREGVSESLARLADHRIVIPMVGMVRSLNVSVATGVVLYEAQRQRAEKGMYDRPSLSEEEIKALLKKWAYEDVLKERKR